MDPNAGANFQLGSLVGIPNSMARNGATDREVSQYVDVEWYLQQASAAKIKFAAREQNDEVSTTVGSILI